MEVSTTNSAIKTKELAKKLALTIRAGDTLLLFGELGSGKTTFTQGLAEAWGVTGRVTSPTFTLHKTYVGALRAQPVKINHIDCYRIKNAVDADSLGLKEVFDDPGAINIVEWPERIKNLWPTNAVKISFEVDPSDDNKRLIEIKN